MKIILLCICCTFVHIPSIVLRYVPFREEVTVKQKKLLYLVYGIALVLNALLYAWMERNGGITIQFYKFNLVLFCVILACVNGLIIRHRMREHFFTFGLTAIIIYLLLSITAFAEDKLPIADITTQIIINAGMLCVLFVMLYPVLGKLMRMTITPFLQEDSKEYWKSIWFIPVAMFFASLMAFPMNAHMTTVLQLASRLMVGAATLFVCKSMSYDYVQLQKREELNQSLDRQKEYYQALSEKVGEARRARHDFKHHAAVLKAYVDQKDYNGLSDYINDLTDTGVSDTFIPFTGNSAADGIIYHYVLLCEKENIHFEIEGMLNDGKIADVDLCVLLGNALDNAYTACKTSGENPYIHLAFQQKDGLLTITMQNSFDGIVMKKDEKILSKKRIQAEGVGLSSMIKICEKYGGDMKLGYDKQVFSLMLLLNLWDL